MKKKKNKPLSPLGALRRLKSADERSTHATVLEHENDAAALIEGDRHRGSGASMYRKSDASSERYQLEAKQTEKKSLSLKAEWLIKITKEAIAQRKVPLLSIRFLNIREVLVDNDWVLLPASEFRELMEKAKRHETADDQ